MGVNLGETPMTVVVINPSTGVTIPPLTGNLSGSTARINFGETPQTTVAVDPATGQPIVVS